METQQPFSLCNCIVAPDGGVKEPRRSPVVLSVLLVFTRQCCTVAGVLDEPFYQLTPLSGVAVQARQSESTNAGTVSILCSLTGRYSYSSERT
jgi:hypothetical protein